MYSEIVEDFLINTIICSKRVNTISRNKTRLRLRAQSQRALVTLPPQAQPLIKTKYSYKTPFEDEVGPNPEELVADAHAGCFKMVLTLAPFGAGFTADELQAKGGIIIESIQLPKVRLK